MVVTICIAAGSVVALTLLTRPVVGVIWAAVLLGFGAGLAYRSARGSLPRRVAVSHNDDSMHRLLVIANQTVAGEALLEEIRNRTRGRSSEVLVVTPALVGSRAAHWASDVDQGIELARRRMEQSLLAIRAAGLQARGEIGDSDPSVAIEDALRQFPADEIVVSTLPPEKSRWLEHGVVDRTRAEVDLPVTHVIVDVERQGAAA